MEIGSLEDLEDEFDSILEMDLPVIKNLVTVEIKRRRNSGAKKRNPKSRKEQVRENLRRFRAKNGVGI